MEKKKTTARKKTTTARKLCSKVIRREGVKANGQLMKGYRWKKGSNGVAVKATATKPAAKRKAPAKKAALKKPAARRSVSEGINKTTGRLKKGYRYNERGRVVKAKVKK